MPENTKDLVINYLLDQVKNLTFENAVLQARLETSQLENMKLAQELSKNNTGEELEAKEEENG